MSKKLAILLASAFALLAIAIVIANRSRTRIVGPWQITGSVGPDSIARAMASKVGAPPDSLGSCGKLRLRIVYINAPIDSPIHVRRERTAHSVSDYVSYGGTADTENRVVDAIATSAWLGGARSDSIDSVTVKLVRVENKRSPHYGASEWSEFNFHRDPRNGQELIRIDPGQRPCSTSG